MRSLGKTLLAFALLHSVLQGHIFLLLQVCLHLLLLHSGLLYWKGHLFWVLVLQGLVGLHRISQLQLLLHYWSGHRLGLLWYCILALEMFRDHSVVFEIASKYCILESFVYYEGYCISFMEKAMAPHSSTLAWKIPWMEELGGLQSTGSLRVGHDWATSLSLFTFMLWRRKWQPTPVFLPGESQGWGSLVGCHLWGRTESDMTEVT